MRDQAAFIAVQRFGLGARPGELRQVRSDPRGWLREQVGQSALPPGTVVGPSSRETIENELTRMPRGEKGDMARAEKKRQRQMMRGELGNRLHLRMRTDTPFAERLIAFWTNHFSISASAGANHLVHGITGSFEREAMRPHAFGKFEDLAFSALTHPGMVHYLDNERSVGPNSALGSRPGETINENLARETLELYILGVNGGYTQADVEQMSLVLSGWSYRYVSLERKLKGVKRRVPNMKPMEQHGFGQFFPAMHEPGSKTIVGTTYKDAGADEFRQVIQTLTKHPSTAQFIASKLARHFIADDPPQSAVDQLAKTFQETNGNLETLSLALINVKEAWEQPLTKIKSPADLVLSAGRALDAAGNDGFGPMQAMSALGQPMLRAPDPRGWPDVDEAWISPAQVMRRVEWIGATSRSKFKNLDPRQLIDNALGDMASDRLRESVRGAPSTGEAVALVLLSPEFQRR